MRWLLVPLLLLASVAAAQTSEISLTPHALRTMNVAQLRASLFDGNAPEFVESWVEGPTHRSEFLAIELATRPRPTAYLSLCAVDIGLASGRWTAGKQSEDSPLKMAKGRIDHLFMLTDDMPSLARGTVASEPCSAISPLFREFGPHPIAVSFYEPGGAVFTNADAARFGFVAVRSARDAAKRLPVKTQRCASGFTDIPLACNAPADFVRTRHIRDVAALSIRQCEDAATLCVDATIARQDGCDLPIWAGPCGEDHVIVETDLRSLADNDALDATHIRAIEVRAGSNPIV